MTVVQSQGILIIDIINYFNDLILGVKINLALLS